MSSWLTTQTAPANDAVTTSGESIIYHHTANMGGLRLHLCYYGPALRALAACPSVPVDGHQVDVRVPAALWAVILASRHEWLRAAYVTEAGDE